MQSSLYALCNDFFVTCINLEHCFAPSRTTTSHLLLVLAMLRHAHKSPSPFITPQQTCIYIKDTLHNLDLYAHLGTSKTMNLPHIKRLDLVYVSRPLDLIAFLWARNSPYLLQWISPQKQIKLKPEFETENSRLCVWFVLFVNAVTIETGI